MLTALAYVDPMLPTVLLAAHALTGTALAGYTLEVAPAHPRPGEDVVLRLAWTNTGDEPVRVPVDLLDDVRITVDRAPGRGRRGVGRLARVGPGPTRDPVEVAWSTVDADAAIERFLSVAEHVPGCDPSCAPGGWAITVEVDNIAIPDAGPGRLDPRPAMFRAEWTSMGPRLSVTDPRHLDVSLVRGRIRGERVVVEARATNQAGVPMWVPRRPFVSGCDVRLRVDGAEDEIGMGAGIGGGGPWDEDSGVLLHPGEHTTWDLDCEVDVRDADAAWVRVEIHPVGTFVPRRIDSPPAFLDAVVSSTEVRVR